MRHAAAELRQPWWSVSPFGLVESTVEAEPQPWEDPVDAVSVTPDIGDAIALSAQPTTLYHGETARVIKDVEEWRLCRELRRSRPR